MAPAQPLRGRAVATALTILMAALLGVATPALATDGGVGAEVTGRLAYGGHFIAGVAGADGATDAAYTCYAATSDPTASVTIPAVDGCILQWRPTPTSAWATVDIAPGRTLPGMVTVTADVPDVPSGAYRVCYTAYASHVDGTTTDGPRACSSSADLDGLAPTPEDPTSLLDVYRTYCQDWDLRPSASEPACSALYAVTHPYSPSSDEPPEDAEPDDEGNGEPDSRGDDRRSPRQGA